MIIPPPNCMDTAETGTLSLTEARERILARVVPVTGDETVPLSSALYRILGGEIRSPLDVPGHTNAAVDGFANRGEDLPHPGKSAEFSITGTASAGRPFSGRIESGEAVRIMTGAPLPEGSDTVLMQEQVEEYSGRIRVEDGHRCGENVRQAGEDIQQGQTVLTAGRLLRPQELGLIASLGRLEVTVRRKLRVGILSTGDEILPQGTPRVPGRIYDSNRFSLYGTLQKLPSEIVDYGILPDDEIRLERTFQEAAARCDVVISSGGVSVGMADHTRKVLQNLGNIEFWKVAIKPGRPLVFGDIRDTLFFGLPGNPVAVLVSFYQFVLPALYRCAGAGAPPLIPTFAARTRERLRKKPGRTEFPRGILDRGEDGVWEVRSVGRQGSGVLSSMTEGNCFIVLEHDRGPVEAGERVEVLPFSVLI